MSRPGLQQSARGPSPTRPGSCGQPVGSRHVGRAPARRPSARIRVVVDREARRRRRTGSVSTRAPWSSTAAQVVGGVEPGGLGQLRAQVRHLHDPGRRARRTAARSPATHSTGEHARVERARARGPPGRRRAMAATRVGVRRRRRPGTSSTRADAARAGRRPRPGPRPARRRRRPSARPARCVAGQHPADRAEQAAGLVERGGEVAERLGEADEHEVAERVALELAAAEAVLERRRPRRCRRRRARRGTARMSPGGGTPRSRRSRPDEPPSSATLTTAVTVARVAARSRAARSRGRARRRARRPSGRVGIASVTVDVPVVDARREAEPLEHVAPSSSAITTLRCRPPVQPIADRQVRLALAHVRGEQQREQPLELLEERLRPRAAPST